MTRAIPLLILTVLTLAAGADPQPPAAGAPTPQQAWAATVDAFTKALVKGDLPALDATLAPRRTLRVFGGRRDLEAWQLFERVMDAALVGQHGYVHPPLVMAADVAADFKNAPAIPERAKARFLVDDESDMRRANHTAVAWLEEQLAATPGTPVGVIVLWAPRRAAPATGPTAVPPPPTHDPVFVLLKGEEVRPGHVQVRTVLFGSPVPEANH